MHRLANASLSQGGLGAHRDAGLARQTFARNLDPMPSHRTIRTLAAHHSGTSPSIHVRNPHSVGAFDCSISRHVNSQHRLGGLRATQTSEASTAVIDTPNQDLEQAFSHGRRQETAASTSCDTMSGRMAADFDAEHDSASMAYKGSSGSPSSSGSSSATPGGGGGPAASNSGTGGFAYAPSERSQIRETWATLMRWSKRTRQQENINPLDSTSKVSRSILLHLGGCFDWMLLKSNPCWVRVTAEYGP